MFLDRKPGGRGPDRNARAKLKTNPLKQRLIAQAYARGDEMSAIRALHGPISESYANRLARLHGLGGRRPGIRNKRRSLTCCPHCGVSLDQQASV